MMVFRAPTWTWRINFSDCGGDARDAPVCRWGWVVGVKECLVGDAIDS